MTPIQVGAFRAFAGAVLASAALGCAAEGPRNEPSAVLFENVTVVPMDQDRVLERRSVLVEAGRISAIGPAGSLPFPQGARRIDGTGKFLMPGLADMHVHLYDTDGFLSYLAYGVTTVANLDGNPRVLERRDAVNSGRLLGPTVYTTGPSLDGVPAGNELFVSLANPSDARAEVTRQHRAGYDMLKVYSGLGADEYDAVIDQARNEHMPVIGHVPLDVGADRTLHGPQANIAHMEEVYNGYSSGVGAILEGKPSDTTFIPRIAAAVKRSGTTVTPNLFAFSDYLRSIADLPAVLADSEMR